MCQRSKAGIWQVVQNIPLPVSDFNGLQTIALGDGSKGAVQSIAFLGQNAVAWMPLAGTVWHLSSLDGYDTPVKDGYLDDVETGDLNGDGRKELVFLETTQHYLDIVSFDSHHKLIPAIRWKVFEEHTFRDDSGGTSEPREVLLANVTGHKDKKKDLVLVVHDRVLVYPQE
jgi:hypothetical protein